MVKVQVLLYVQHSIPPPTLEDDCLPNRHDPLRVFRVCRHGSALRSVIAANFENEN